MIAFCATLVVACVATKKTGRGAESGGQPGGAAIPAGVTFDADVAITSTDLTVTWRVVNRSGNEVVIPTLVPHEGMVPRREAYIVAAGNNIEIAQRLFDWPDEVQNLAAPPSVGVLRVPPDTTESRTIRVLRPLTAYHPFGDAFDDGPPALPSDPAGVVFCLGVVAQPYPPALQLENVDGVEIAVHGRVSYAQQHRFCTDPLPFR
ncbi:hypothetical protein [Nocardia gipuzkoensis]